MCVGEGAMEMFCPAVSVHTDRGFPELQITRGVHQGSHPCTAQGKKYRLKEKNPVRLGKQFSN